MICPDVNVLLYAFRRESDRHSEYRKWLADVMAGEEPVGVSELVLSGVVRIATNHRMYREPSLTTKVLDFCQALREAPAAVALRPGRNHWAIFDRLCRLPGVTANIVPDAYHAALAIENGATWITTDSGFARFPQLRWRHPFT